MDAPTPETVEWYIVLAIVIGFVRCWLCIGNIVAAIVGYFENNIRIDIGLRIIVTILWPLFVLITLGYGVFILLDKLLFVGTTNLMIRLFGSRRNRW